MTTAVSAVSHNLPPGPDVWGLLKGLVQLRTDRLTPLEDIMRTYGDIAYFRVVGHQFFFVNHPDHYHEILVTRHKDFHKDEGYRFLEALLGKGLLTSEDAFHLRQRRMIQPAFHRQRIAEYGAAMVDCARVARDRWRDGQAIDAAAEMMAVALDIVGRTLFNTDTHGYAQTIAHAMDTVLQFDERYFLPGGTLLNHLPLPSTRRFKAALRDLDRVIYQMIAEHRAEGDRKDLLTMLLHARDEDDGTQMTDRQVRDEALTLFLAGHETTANALAWTWFCLSRNPDAEAKLHAEVDAVLAGRDATADDYAALPYTKQVFAEAMRLYPPAYAFGRKAIRDTEVGGYPMPKGSQVAMSPFVIQRDARYYPEPEAFRPERFEPEAWAQRPKFAYAPFGGGNRRCIGEPFAWMEGVLVLATLAQRWRLSCAPDLVPIPDPKVTLRPRGGLPMTVHAR